MERRTRELFGNSASAGLVPKEVLEEIERSADAKGPRRPTWDKSSTPAEPASVDEEDQFSKARPQIIDAQRDETVRLDEQASRNAALGEFSTLKIHNGCNMIDKWKSEYLCMAMQFTLLLLVGGHDARGDRHRWRRPDDAAQVMLLDLVRGLPRRCEAQFRRHWPFVPGLWNLYFRELVNFGKSLSVRHRPNASKPANSDDEDVARDARRLYEKLERGMYTDEHGACRSIAGSRRT